MNAEVVAQDDSSFTIVVKVPRNNSMLAAEEQLQISLNEAGSVGTKEILSQFDTDGSPIQIGECKLTSKGKEPKEYQTPYGPVEVDRYVYQGTKGGKTHVPLEIGARIIVTSTPKFAKMVSSKYACDSAPAVQRDLTDNHSRPIAVSYIKNLSDAVGTIALAKEESWTYSLPELPNRVASIAVGLDGTCLNMMEDGWREAMCGTIAFFDKNGDRMHTVYTASAPEYGKENFLNKFGNEVDNVIELFPKAPIVGLADGASSNWPFLEQYSDILMLDFWHATEYLAKAGQAMFPRKNQKEDRESWLDEACHRLKHKMGGASRLLNEMEEFEQRYKMSASNKEKLQKAITYFANQKGRMGYYKNVNAKMPIGSGVTEAACKSIVKQRMCKGSARWKDEGAAVVLTIRSIHMTNFRWEQFWSKYSQYGYQVAA